MLLVDGIGLRYSKGYRFGARQWSDDVFMPPSLDEWGDKQVVWMDLKGN